MMKKARLISLPVFWQVLGLSLAVLRAVDEAVPLTESLIADMLGALGGEGHA